jgi:HAE1 family hydrophobic/amphiphilic exporter-1
MLSSFSVRKPFTVLVAVIMIIVLGVVSFTGMTTDLLPAMELPYVIVSTSYPGASPEKVEQTVTRPLEAALGTAGGLKNISSVSNENYSMIMLEYEQSTNMDSAMIELSGSIDMVSAQLADGVGAPMMLRISADMMPVVVASVDREGMNIDEISDFASDTVIPAFERIDGVASVTTSGLLEKQLEIKIDEEAVAALNQQVRAELEQTFNENRAELEEAVSELEQGQATLDAEAPEQKQQLAQASSQVNNAIANLNALLAEESILEAQKAALNRKKQGLHNCLILILCLLRFSPMALPSCHLKCTRRRCSN